MLVFLITSSLLGSVNFIVTIVQLRAKGRTWMRLPFFVWAQFVTSFLLLLAFPPLEAAGVLQLMDRLAGTSFFMPSGLVISGKQMLIAGNGNPLLWQHLFWFLAHPEVYVLILPAMGIVAEIIANNTRKPLWGYRPMVYSLVFLGLMSVLVWAHPMFMAGRGPPRAVFSQPAAAGPGLGSFPLPSSPWAPARAPGFLSASQSRRRERATPRQDAGRAAGRDAAAPVRNAAALRPDPPRRPMREG